MYLKALQRPRRVPMRCSNEGFFHTTTHLVASLHLNLIIFSFCVRSPFSALCHSVSLASSHTLFFLSRSLISFHLLHLSPQIFSSLIPSLFQLRGNVRFFGNRALGCRSWYLPLMIHPFHIYVFCLHASIATLRTVHLVSGSYLVPLNCESRFEPTSDKWPLSQPSVFFLWRPCPPTLFHPSTPILWPHSVRGEQALACHILIQSAV